MIKKNTKVIFENGNDEHSEDLVGGIPLSKGELINVHDAHGIRVYVVADKIVDCFMEGADQTVNITYIVRKQ